MKIRQILSLLACCVLAVCVLAQQPTPQPLTPGEPKKITAAEAEELFRSVDAIAQFVAGDTGLKVKAEIKRQLASQDQVQAYVRKKLTEDEDAQRLKRSELILKKLGLLPKDFKLEEFLVAMLREQVAGYYEPEDKTLYILDWLPTETQIPVLAHEITHAVQDQNFDLEAWLKQAKQTPEGKKRPDAEADEAQMARHAVAEGQGMVVMIDHMLAPMGQSLMTMPQLAEAIKAGMLVGTGSPVYNSAPLFLKESLTFPYRFGLDLIRAVLTARGKDAAYSGLFRNPPTNAREVMEPETYLAGEHVPQLPMPDVLAVLGKTYDAFDSGSIGEFDVYMLLKQWSGDEAQSLKFARNWRGGWYYAAQRRGAGADKVALVYLSKWASAEAATEFVQRYGAGVAQRNPKAVKKESKSGTRWETEDGPIIIRAIGDLVVVTESFDDKMAERLQKEVTRK